MKTGRWVLKIRNRIDIDHLDTVSYNNNCDLGQTHQIDKADAHDMYKTFISDNKRKIK